MELFKVTCVTCQAKLSVRNEALIGQIVACPRCESMVEVARPASPSSAAAVTTAGASTGSTINITARQAKGLDDAAVDQIAIDQESAAQAPAGQSPPAATPPVATPFENMPLEQTPAKQIHPTSVAGEAAVAAEAMSAEAPQTVAVQANAAVARYKLLTWSIASFVVGASIVGAVVYKSTRPTAEPISPATDAVPRAIDSSNDRVKVPAAVVSEQPTDPEAVSSIDASPTPEPIEPSSQVEDAAATVAATEIPAEEAGPAPLAIEQPEVATPVQPKSEPAQTLVVEPAPRLARRFDPLEVDLESLSLTTMKQPQAVQTEAVEIPDPEESTTPEPSVPKPESIAEPVRTTQLALEQDHEVANRDAEKQLQLIIPTVEASKLPLVDALRLLSQLSGQPVSVAPEQLLMAGVTPQQKVSLQVADMSMGEGLQELLSPLRLEYFTDGPQIVIRRQQADKLRQIEYPIDDLVSADQDEKVFAGWIEQLITPESWQSAGGNGTLETAAGKLKITQPQHVQYQVLILLERLRLARELPPKSRYPVKRLAGTPATLLIAEQLDRTTTFTFSQFTMLEEVFAYWQTKLEVPLLIDWPALAQSDLWPTTTIKGAIIEEPWHAALSNVLQPIGLDWRAATGGAIEITTTAKVQNELQLEVYPMQSSVDIKKLRKLAANDAGVLLHDPVSNVVLSLQPAATQRLLLHELK